MIGREAGVDAAAGAVIAAGAVGLAGADDTVGAVGLARRVAEALELVVPAECAGCGAWGTALCAECRAHLRDPPCDVTERAPLLEDVVTTWTIGDYHGVLRRVVVGWKTGRRGHLRAELADAGRLAGERLWPLLARDVGTRLAVVPAPSRPSRRRSGLLVAGELADAVAAGLARGAREDARRDVRSDVRRDAQRDARRDRGAGVGAGSRPSVGEGVASGPSEGAGAGSRPSDGAGAGARQGASAGARQAPGSAARAGSVRIAAVDLLRTAPGRRQRGASRRRRLTNRAEPPRTLARLPAGTAVLLVDDVVTTGATLAGCVTAVRRAGGRVVGAFAVAGAPPPDR